MIALVVAIAALEVVVPLYRGVSPSVLTLTATCLLVVSMVLNIRGVKNCVLEGPVLEDGLTRT